MQYKRIIAFMLLFIFLFNFIFIPKPQASVALTLGGLGLTYKVAQAIYLTVLVAAGIGVTFMTWQEAKKFYDVVEGTSPVPLDYPGWEEAVEEVKKSKAELANEYWFAQWGLEVLPGGQQDPDPNNNNKRGILALLGGVGIIGCFISNFISMFQKLELEEDINIIDSSNTKKYGDYSYSLRTIKYDDQIELQMSINGSPYFQVLRGDVATTRNYVFDTITITDKGDGKVYITGYRQREEKRGQEWYIWREFTGINGSNIPDEYIQNPDELLNIKVDPDSPIFDGGSAGEIKYPQPNLIPIPRYNPSTTPLLNPDGTPRPGIQLILNPDGSIEERYYGDVDDLLEDIVMNTPIDEILNPDINPYIITPGEDYITITRPDPDPTVPYPQPKPPTRPEIWPPLTPDPDTWPSTVPYPEWPQPDPDTWPQQYPYPTKPDPWPPLEPIPWPDPDTWPPTIPYPYPDPDIWPPTVPYPFPQPEPNPNPSPQIPVESGKQIDYTSWLQIIINWLSRIFNKIPNEEVDSEVPQIDFSPITNISISDKFPFSIPWDLRDSVEMLASEGKAPKWDVPIVTETITIDMAEFEQIASIMRVFNTLLFIVALIMLTRRLI